MYRANVEKGTGPEMWRLQEVPWMSEQVRAGSVLNGHERGKLQHQEQQTASQNRESVIPLPNPNLSPPVVQCSGF